MFSRFFSFPPAVKGTMVKPENPGKTLWNLVKDDDVDEDEDDVVEKVKKFFKTYSNINKSVVNWVNPEDNDSTPLYLTATEDSYNYSVADLLISKGADVNKANRNGETPLYRAAANGLSDVVSLLIKKGADINQKTNDKTPLEIAREKLELCTKKHERELYESIIKQLENTKGQGVSEEKKLYDAGEALFNAARRCDVGDLTTLCRNYEGNSSVLNWENDRYRLTPLGVLSSPYVANPENRAKCARILLKTNGIKVNQQNGHGETPLVYALRWRTEEIAMELLNHADVDVNLAPPAGAFMGTTPAFLATKRGYLDILKKLIEKGADLTKMPNERKYRSKTLLEVATKKKHKKIVELLKTQPSNGGSKNLKKTKRRPHNKKRKSVKKKTN
jgi:ankyrin repeat protein